MTPQTGVGENWIVDDSEDEFSMEIERPGQDAQSSRIQSATAMETSTIPEGISPIETALQPRVDAGGQSIISSFSAPLQKAGEQSTISSYTPAAGDISSSSKPSKPRPRPRPAFKGARSDTTAPTSDPSALQTPSSDRLLPPTVVVDSNTESLTVPMAGQNIPDYPQDIAERAKMRSRKAAIPYREEVIIDLSSDDEIALPSPKPKVKPKPKPRPAKRAKTDHPNPGDVSIAESETVTIPVPSSSFPLPPSDLLPPIPPSKRAAPDQDSSPMVSPVRKRKRKTMRIDDDSDEGAGNAPMDIDKDTITMPPPELPRFFVGSSTSDATPLTEGLVASSEKMNGKTKKAVEDTPAKAKKTKAKAKATNKKPSVEVVIKSPPKGKGKSKKTTEGDLPVKSSGKSSEKADAGLDDDAYLSAVDDSQGEDELQLLPPKSKAKAKKAPSSSKSSDGPKSGKGKQKAAASSNADARPTPRARGVKGRDVVLSDDEEDADREASPPRSRGSKNRKSSVKEDNILQKEGSEKPASKSSDDVPVPQTPVRSKENVHPKSPNNADGAESALNTPAKDTSSSSARVFTRGYTFSRPAKATPMQELIRRATSHPNSPFQPSPKQSPYHSPLFKATKSALRKIAPLHPNRRTPPPPLPPPPPPKKSKKMLDLEEKWEMELEDEVPGWWSLTDEERKEWRRAKKDKELGFED